MLQITIDGKPLVVPQGTSVIEATNEAGVYVPHFCYHKKLSIAANCRMCLVEVEKAPKPLPACATPVTDGMVVKTNSPIAKAAQQGVMEFLLINHPLDCPVCDQGGECQLQDLSVGYGKSETRYQEEKRVVEAKDMGALVSAEEMSRCIHCTRCVRFTDEIGGYQEIGMAHRSEHAEILPFLNKTVDSEISGNIIDLCPVGALTSKPFRYTARTWELSRRKSIAAHDALGSNVTVQVKDHRVMRVLPLQHDGINECWLSDRDRFAYEGLNHADRLTSPMVKQNGQWQTISWDDALAYVVRTLQDVKADHQADAIGFLLSQQSTNEELFLAASLARALGVEHIDSRLRQQDTRADASRTGAPWLGADLNTLLRSDQLWVIGSSLRSEQPLLTARIRQAAKKSLKLHVLHHRQDALQMNVATQTVMQPQDWALWMTQVLKAVAQVTEQTLDLDLSHITVSDEAHHLAAQLVQSKQAHILLGQVAEMHPDYSQLLGLAQAIAHVIHAKVGILGHAANTVGAHVVGAVPINGGLSAQEMIAKPRKAYVLMNTELELDSMFGAQAQEAMLAASSVMVLTPYISETMKAYADLLLPIVPNTETAGSFMNMEGRLQTFNPVVKPLGDAKPAWKVLRVLGGLLGLDGFDFDTIESVRAVCAPCDLSGTLATHYPVPLSLPVANESLLIHVPEVPMYHTDAIVRRAASLQKTVHAAKLDCFLLNEATATVLGCAEGDQVVLTHNGKRVTMPLAIDPQLADGVLKTWSATGHSLDLPRAFAPVDLRKVTL